MICEICGRKTNKLKKVVVDGAELMVCEACSKYGRELYQDKKEKVEKVVKKVIDVQEEEISEDFHKILREKREKEGLTQEEMAKKLGIKESLYKKLEEGDVKPSLDLAKKIEKILGVKLTKKVILFEEEEKKTFGLTVADVIKFED